MIEALHITKEALNVDTKPMEINTAENEEDIPLLGNPAPEKSDLLLPTLA